MVKPGEFPDAVVDLIWERDRGCCALCGVGLVWERRGEPFGGWSVQHREARKQGGAKGRPWVARAANGVVLCGTGTTGCHGDVEHHSDNVKPVWGFSVSALGIRRPVEVPLRHAALGWVLLNDAGGWEPVDEPVDDLAAAA
ncbi:hypothetical protein [Microbacterium sp. Bi128]|uniref:hypothetical protein n=1 Tax=Microbacterium sp. Bi128 TaxID=2821115 RepID=UPI001DB74B9A|nr:hypothetical protein [Microbacterium sp. Bi128]CAH0253756.1 hypothetical protein SRABI128_02974 [Microbacterium sp. Bi128]